MIILTGLADAQARMGVVQAHVVTAVVKVTDWDDDTLKYLVFQSRPSTPQNPFATATHAEVAFMTWFYSEYIPKDTQSFGGYCDVFLRFTPCTVNDGSHQSANQWGTPVAPAPATGADAPAGCHEKLVEMAKAYPTWTFRVFSQSQYDPTGVQRNINGRGPYNPCLFHDSDSTARNLKMEIQSLDVCRGLIAAAG